ncbi:MAG: alginate export family protein [Halieaceae bacterium]|jgi:hypothetical protein|nr:alginate export family protein [Halieaceae bacterium]
MNKKQSQFSLLAISAAVAMAIAPYSQGADSVTESLASMVTNGKTSFNFRYRYEGVDQKGYDEDAGASTLRSRLTFASAAYNGFSFLAEFDDVSALGSERYNSTRNGQTEYPVVADPEGTDVNQAWVKYASGKASGTYGRQRILHGSQRFVGGVGWRQNEQTYDGFRATYAPEESVKLDYSYVYNINRIFGPDDGAQPADWGGENHLFTVDYTPAKGHKVGAFAYLLDIDEQSGYPAGKTTNNSTDTYGFEYTGKFDPITLSARYASQSDAGSSTLSYDTDYYMVELGGKISAISLKAGYEVLASDNGVGFKTPLATLHKFQGWADKFLGTPGDGIEDMYFNIAGKAGPVKLAAVYHDFSAETGGDEFGSEIDLVATWPVNKQLMVQAKFASFSSDNKSRYASTDKAWFTVQLKL